MTETTARFSLPYIMPAQAQKHLTHNQALRYLDLFLNLSVIDDATPIPPPIAQENAAFIIPDGAMDAWSGRAAQVTVFWDGAWQFFTPVIGWTAWVQSRQSAITFNGNNWVTATQSEGGTDIKTAYDIAVENGFQGSESEWLTSLIGADGRDGADGAIGPMGPKGDPGTTNWDGLTDKPIFYSYFTIWAEENGDLNTGAKEWAFGNGNDSPAGVGVILPFDCELFALGLSTEGAASCEVEVLKNTESSGKSVATTNQTKAVTSFETTAVSYASGDIVGFNTIIGSADSNEAVVSAWFRRAIL